MMKAREFIKEWYKEHGDFDTIEIHITSFENVLEEYAQSQNKELTEQLEKIDRIANDILMDASQYPDDELNQQAGDIRGIIHELTQNQE